MEDVMLTTSTGNNSIHRNGRRIIAAIRVPMAMALAIGRGSESQPRRQKGDTPGLVGLGVLVALMALWVPPAAASAAQPAATSPAAATRASTETTRPDPGTFVALTPARIMDTRMGTGASGPVTAGETIPLQVDGAGGVPASGVSAVVLNVTVTQPQVGGYVTVFPVGSNQPPTSNLNFNPGETIPNLVIAPVGADGKVDFHNGSAGTIQIIADVSGWFSPPTTITSVSFTGSSATPTITVNGSGFGTVPPSASPGCEASGTEYVNDDLYIVDNTQNWTAGEPGACISVANVSWTNTQVVFNFAGSYGTTCCGVDWVLNPGDNVTVQLLGATDTLTVGYPPPTIAFTVIGIPNPPSTAPPTIMVTGSGFGIAPPSASPGCDTSGTEYVNNDLTITDNTEHWTAGEPGACISLANVSWTNTQIAFNLAGMYGTTCCGSDWVLNPGDNVTVQVLGATVTLTLG